MTKDMQYWDDALREEVRSIHQLLDMAKWLSDVGKVSAIFRAEKKLLAAQGTKEAYTMEARNVRNPDRRQVYEDRLSRLSEELESCVNSLNKVRESLASKYDCGGAAGKDSAVDDSKIRMYHRAKESLQTIRNVVVSSSSKRVGCEDLMRQREEMRTIDDEVAARAEDESKKLDSIVDKVRMRMSGH